jgi:hypothetical protein
MPKSRQTADTETRLGQTTVDALYLALEMQALGADLCYVDRKSSQLLSELLHAWARRQAIRQADGLPSFRSLSLVVDREAPDLRQAETA